MGITIKKLLIIGMSITIVTTLLLNSITVLNLSKLSRSKDNVFNKMTKSVDITDVSKIGADLYKTIASTVINMDFEKSKGEWREKKEKALKDIERMAGIADTPQEKELVAKSKKGLDEMIRLYENELLPLLKTQTMTLSESIMVLGESIDKQDVSIKENLTKLSQVMKDKARAADEDFESTRRGTNWNSLIVGFITLIVLTYIWLINLRKVAHIGQRAKTVASASQQMFTASDNMSKTISSERERIIQMAAAMEEMSATVIEVSKNTTEVSDYAKQTMKIAESGSAIVQEGIDSTNRIADKVKELTGTVDALGSGSQKIGEIISVIDDIADQTNLLALNAAIEAARAGEQGRGFAVVADEVRKLAERTTKATKEISEMIKTIQKDTEEAVISMEAGRREVAAGVEASIKTGESFRDIATSVRTITDRISQIATASEEQAAASEEVASNIDNISRGIGEVSEGSRQNADIAGELSRQAAVVQDTIGQFKVPGTSA